MESNNSINQTYNSPNTTQLPEQSISTKSTPHNAKSISEIPQSSQNYNHCFLQINSPQDNCDFSYDPHQNVRVINQSSLDTNSNIGYQNPFHSQYVIKQIQSQTLILSKIVSSPFTKIADHQKQSSQPQNCFLSSNFKASDKQVPNITKENQLQQPKQLIKNQQILNLKQRLQQTQQRMGEQNAYLRESMFKLHDELEHYKGNIINKLNKQIYDLDIQNKYFKKQIKKRTQQINKCQLKYKQLSNKIQQQRIFKQLQQTKQIKQLKDEITLLQTHKEQSFLTIQNLQQQNKQLIQRIFRQSELNKKLMKDNSYVIKDMQNHKQIAEQLKSNIKKLKQQNISLSKSIESHTHKMGLFSSRNNNQRINKSLMNKNKSVRKLNSSEISLLQKQQNDKIGVDMNIYLSKTKQFQQLRIKLQQNKSYPFMIEIIHLCSYFNESCDKLLIEKINDKKSVQKYKKLVMITVDNPKTQIKSMDFINDLIQKCNLLESSVEQKKNTIELLNQQINDYKKNQRSTSQVKQDKVRFNCQMSKLNQYLNEKQIKKQSNQLLKNNIQFTQNQSNTNTNTNTNSHPDSKSNILQRMKQFKPFPIGNQRIKTQQSINNSLSRSFIFNRNDSLGKIKVQQDQTFQNSSVNYNRQQLSSVSSQSGFTYFNDGKRLANIKQRKKYQKLHQLNTSFLSNNLIKPRTTQSITPQSQNKRRLEQLSINSVLYIETNQNLINYQYQYSNQYKLLKLWQRMIIIQLFFLIVFIQLTIIQLNSKIVKLRYYKHLKQKHNN